MFFSFLLKKGDFALYGFGGTQLYFYEMKKGDNFLDYKVRLVRMLVAGEELPTHGMSKSSKSSCSKTCKVRTAVQ